MFYSIDPLKVIIQRIFLKINNLFKKNNHSIYKIIYFKFFSILYLSNTSKIWIKTKKNYNTQTYLTY